VKYVQEEPKSPVEVVRDDKLLKEFSSSAQIPISDTGLGKKRKHEKMELPDQVADLGSLISPWWVAGAGAAGGAYLLYRKRAKISSLLQSSTSSLATEVRATIPVAQLEPSDRILEANAGPLSCPWE